MPVPGPPGKPLHKAIVNIGKGVDSAWACPSSKSASSLYQIKEGEHESLTSSSEDDDTRAGISANGTRLRRQSSGCDTVQTPMSRERGSSYVREQRDEQGSVDFELEL